VTTHIINRHPILFLYIDPSSLSQQLPYQMMGGNTFPGRYGANPFDHDPFALTTGVRSSGAIHQVTEEDENDTVTSPTTGSFGVHYSSGGPFGGDGTRDCPPSSFKPATEGFPNNYGMGRRTSVSAESLNPTASSNDNWTPPYHPKTPDQLTRLKSAIGGHTLFRSLDDEQSAQIIGALVEKPIPAKNIKVRSDAPELTLP
jgi:cAMP-dependent protein kinase regulator